MCNVWKSDNLIRKIVCNETIGLIASKFDKFIAYNHEKLADLKLVGSSI